MKSIKQVMSKLNHINGISVYNDFQIVTLLYVMDKVQKMGNEIEFSDLISSVKDEDIRLTICDMVDEKAFDEIKNIAAEFENIPMEQILHEYNAGMDFDKRNVCIHPSITKLIIRMMKIDSVKSIVILDNELDKGNAYCVLAREMPNMHIRSYDNNSAVVGMMKMRTEALNDHAYVQLGDPYALLDGEKLDRVFSFPPLGVRQTNFSEVGKRFNASLKLRPGLTWAHALLAAHLLSENGKAIIPVFGGNLFSMTSSEKLSRKWLIENHFVEGVISLPGGLMSGTSIPFSLVILSHDNSEVRMIDVEESGLYKRSGKIRTVEITEAQIDEIVSNYYDVNESSYCHSAPYEKIRKADYSLDRNHYLAEEYLLKNGTALGDLAVSIFRGAHCSAKEIDELLTQEQTNIYYLTVSDIHGGMIRDDLTKLKEVPEELLKFCLQDGDLVISKSGSPFKSAVINVKDDEKILAAGNFYIVRFDHTKVNPYYVKSYFDSARGTKVLELLSKGTVIRTVSIGDLKRITVPIASKKRQHEIAERYLALQDEIKVLRGRLAKAEDHLNSVFDEVK